MKIILTNTILLFISACASGQFVCGTNWPPENLRPDTVTTYIFNDYSLATKSIPKARASSNFSFQTANFKVTWMPIRTVDINDFVLRSIKSFEKNEVLDTLYCNIFGNAHKAVLLKSKRKFFVMIYRDKLGDQDIFLLKNIKKNKAQQALDFIALNLRQ